MKNFLLPEDDSSGIAINSAKDAQTFLEWMNRPDTGGLCTKPAVTVKLYGMNLAIDEQAGKLIITNSILKKSPVGNFIQVI